MTRPIRSILLCSILALTTLETAINPAYSALAQTFAVTATCDPNSPLQSRYDLAIGQADSTLNSPNPGNALPSLQEAVTIAAQLPNSRTQADLLQQWLLEANEGYSQTQWQRIVDNTDRQTQAAQVRTTLGQFLQLANRLPSGHSYVKTRSLAAIARYYRELDPSQLQQSVRTLEQARQAATFIRGDIFTALALIDVAEVYAAIGETQTAQTVLIQVDQAVQRIPLNTSEGLKSSIIQRMAIAYAQTGNFTTAQQTAARLPNQSEVRSAALRGIVEAYITARNLTQAEQVARSITAPVPRIQALSKLAIAYHNSNPTKANQLLQQARQLSASAVITRDPTLQDFVLRTLVDTYLQLGQRTEALQLAREMGSSQQEAMRSVMIAFSQVGENDVVESWLSERLSYIQSVSDSWEQRMMVGDVLKLAIATQQFAWVQKEWSRISAIDYGPQDWQMVEIANAYAATGRYSQAAQWAQQLSLTNRPVLRVRLLSAIALKAHQGGQTSWANNLLQQTLRSVDALVANYDRQFPGDLSTTPRIKPSSLAAIAVVYSQTGQMDQMRQLLQQVSQLDSSITDPTFGGPVDHPFAVFMEAKQFVGALQLAQATRPSEVRDARLQESATALLQQNRFDLALPVVNQLTNASAKTQLLLAIAQRYGDLQQVNSALPVLAQAFQVAQTIPGEESQVDRLGADGGTIIDITTDRGSMLEAIALQYAQLGQGDRARQVAGRLQDTRLRGEVLQKVECALRGRR